MDKIKLIAKNNYNKFINNLFKVGEDKLINHNIYSDFFIYMTNYLKKYKNNFILEDFVNYVKSNKDDLNTICNL